MTRLIITLLSIFIATTGYAGQKAITDTGEEVILNSDGTWIFANNSSSTEEEIKINKTEFIRPSDSSFLLKSTKNDSAFWINSSKWSFKKATNNIEAEYELQLKGNDLYGIIIAEGIHIPIESLAEIALTNAKNAAPDIKITKKEYRYVNGNKVIYMEMSGTMKGMKITYLGYYYSDESGSTQLLTFTGTSLVSKYQSEISDFLNGLVLQ